MSDTESLNYLQTGFDPATLTVPRIRSILVSHDIEYPSGAKKPQLIQIFTDNVLPQSRKILAARARARRTSKGITDADSQESINPDEEAMPPPPTPRVRSRKTPSRVKSEESESDAPLLRSPSKRTPRASNHHARVSESEAGPDTDTLGRKSVRKSRKSEAPPRAASRPQQDDNDTSPPRRISAFSHDNPFQSGSSPLDGTRSTSGERKRKSLNAKDDASRKSTSSRRRTNDAKVDDHTQPRTSTTFEIPISQLNGLKDTEGDGVEAGEEFTPEEQLELVRDRSLNGVNALGPHRQKRRAARTFSKKGPLWAAAITILGGYATWYRQEKFAVGYCGVGREAVQVIPTRLEIPDWVRVIVEPQCEPCPQHAYCSENLETHCEADFKLNAHPLSVAGLLPFPPTCKPNDEKVRRVKAVADRAVEELRERRAKSECGDPKQETGAPVIAAEIDADELKKYVSQRRRKGLSESEFEELWIGAIGEIEGRDEVIKSSDGHRRLLSSTSLARLPLACAIRRSLKLALAKHRLQIASLGLIILLCFYIRYLFTSHTASNAAIPNLVSLTLDRLATQATLHAQDREGIPEGWISIGQLRDDVLRDEHSVRKREALWAKVKKVVEMNANVRASQREGRSGEISRVWEWIGAVSGENNDRRRTSGRVSWGAYDERSSPVSGTDGGPEVSQTKWEESRPIY